MTKIIAYIEIIKGIHNLIQDDKNLTTTKHRGDILDDRDRAWSNKTKDFYYEQSTSISDGTMHHTR
ncbi:hypothetical protein [Formosa sp. Hel1_31_208]|uniref:hypothetical protein n=1 Tax=Formosa sp. Hel1_31_208 TaxID=1798225 RepID=UPI000B838853|nr:hypothetical protein [Formosa sp. Hel1_31_208]